MRIMITGGAGFIGSALIRHLIEEGDYTVLNFDALTYAGDLETVADVSKSELYQFFHGDIRKKSDLIDAFRQFDPDAVIHLAAESHVDRSISNSADFITTNINGTHTLLSAATAHQQSLSSDRKNHFRFIHVSTDEVYGSLGFDDQPFKIDTPYAPNSPYAASKAASDHLARAWFKTYGLPVIITHCSNNYGPYQYPEKLIPVVIRAALNGQPIPIYGTGENIRDWIHVEDHVLALREILKAGQPGEIYNIGGDCELSNIELVEMICENLQKLLPETAADFKSLINFVEDRKGHDLRYAISNKALYKSLGWSPIVPFEEGLTQTVAWYLDHRDWLNKEQAEAA